MKIEYTKCDFCGKKIDGQYTGKYSYQLVSYLLPHKTYLDDPDVPSSVDICYNCLKVLIDFAKKRSGQF